MKDAFDHRDGYHATGDLDLAAFRALTAALTLQGGIVQAALADVLETRRARTRP